MPRETGGRGIKALGASQPAHASLPEVEALDFLSPITSGFPDLQAVGRRYSCNCHSVRIARSHPSADSNSRSRIRSNRSRT